MRGVDGRSGVLYSCSGEAYVAEALASARSSLRHNDQLEHVLFVSPDALAAAQATAVPGLAVEAFEPSGNPYADKIANMRRSPFERTIYLDTDTFVVDEIAHVLALLDRYDLAAASAPVHRGYDDPEVPQAFFEFNTGVLAWRASDHLAEFMRDWEDTFRRWLREEPFQGAASASARRHATRIGDRSTSAGGLADQPAFRRCAWQHDVCVFVLAPEYNFRLGLPVTVVDRVRVIHGRPRHPEALAARVNRKAGAPRSFPRPHPPRVKARMLARRLRGARSD